MNTRRARPEPPDPPRPKGKTRDVDTRGFPSCGHGSFSSCAGTLYCRPVARVAMSTTITASCGSRAASHPLSRAVYLRGCRGEMGGGGEGGGHLGGGAAANAQAAACGKQLAAQPFVAEGAHVATSGMMAGCFAVSAAMASLASATERLVATASINALNVVASG
eukprot:scaffold6826_cov81-Isochrysis_galbana.AAC.3